jgi:hypothetical protein
MKRIVVVAALLWAMPSLYAQELPKADVEVSRVFQLKYADANRVRSMLLGANEVVADQQMKTIAVRAPKSKMDEIEQIIKRFDVPPPPVPNVEVTIYLMSALAQPAATALPPELDGVVKQLKSTFSYKGYELIDTQIIRVRAGKGGEASGMVGRVAAGPKTINQVKFDEATISTDEKGSAIHLRGLKVGLRIPIAATGQKQYQYLDTGISTDVDVHVGQKVVVGKTNMDGADRASIVVLMAKVVD